MFYNEASMYIKTCLCFKITYRQFVGLSPQVRVVSIHIKNIMYKLHRDFMTSANSHLPQEWTPFLIDLDPRLSSGIPI